MSISMVLARLEDQVGQLTKATVRIADIMAERATSCQHPEGDVFIVTDDQFRMLEEVVGMETTEVVKLILAGGGMSELIDCIRRQERDRAKGE